MSFYNTSSNNYSLADSFNIERKTFGQSKLSEDQMLNVVQSLEHYKIKGESV
mgnify:CR=1 FL=1